MAYHGCHHLSCSSFRSLCYGHHVTAMAFPNRVGFDLTADELAFVDFLQTAHIPPELVRTISQGIQTQQISLEIVKTWWSKLAGAVIDGLMMAVDATQPIDATTIHAALPMPSSDPIESFTATVADQSSTLAVLQGLEQVPAAPSTPRVARNRPVLDQQTTPGTKRRRTRTGNHAELLVKVD